MNIMAEENDAMMAEVMNLSEAGPASLPAAGPDIPAICEELAILVSTGKCKETIGVNLTHEQVKRLEDKEVMRHYKRYETYVGSRTTETLIESTKALSLVVRIKDTEALQNEMKKDFIVSKELSNVSGKLAPEIWPFARFGYRVFDHSKTCRFQR